MTKEMYDRLLTLRMRALKIIYLLSRPRLWGKVATGLREGVFPSLEHASVRFGAQFATVLDVGASRGQFALFALARFPGAKLICFEPLPEAQATARRVLAGRDVELHGIALGLSPGETTLHVSARDDSSSLLPIGSRQVAAFPGTHEDRRVDVPVGVLATYLDENIARPCLLKIDVQGLELDVLRGAGASLDHVDEIFVEVSFVELYTGQALASDVICYLAERDLRLSDVHGIVRAADGTALQADLLFRREQPHEIGRTSHHTHR
jgi:FkbM family methyltransferase